MIVMMTPKDVRPLLSALVHIIFCLLFILCSTSPIRHVDLIKAYSMILGQLYKTLYNIGMRREAEKEEPIDVRLDESLLSSLDKDIIKEWEQKEEKLTILEMRVET
ncbi:hypothetical protein EDD85DRAFT_825895, partial [Armillaria nabsnona]